jgi:hypothetical protein
MERYKSIKDNTQKLNEAIDSAHKIIDKQLLSFKFLLDSNVSEKLTLTEGNWKPYGYQDWWYRTDQADERFNNLFHVHISRKKHINSQPQYSWDKLGKRHDASKFGNNIPQYAKTLASKILGINQELLEKMQTEGHRLLHG